MIACFFPQKETNKIIPRNFINYILWSWDPHKGRWITYWNLCRIKSSAIVDYRKGVLAYKGLYLLPQKSSIMLESFVNNAVPDLFPLLTLQCSAVMNLSHTVEEQESFTTEENIFRVSQAVLRTGLASTSS